MRHSDDWLEGVAPGRSTAARPLIGVLPGDGVGPELVKAALVVLRRLEEAGAPRVDVEFGGPIGDAALRSHGTPLPDDVVAFCSDVFARDGAILNGPGSGRYVYDLRRRLDLFLKISPVQPRTSLPDASPLRPEAVDEVDLLVVRENVGGVYQGRADESVAADGGRVARQAFAYGEADVRRFLDAAARLAASRRGLLTVVVKDAGVQTISTLWRDCARDAAGAADVVLEVVDVDLMAYRLLADAHAFDVVAAPNMCGDVLADLAALLVGARPLSFSGNFTPRGDAVYQTNHGAAQDIAGTGRANPLGQLYSLAMLLRVSLGMDREAGAIEHAIRQVWRAGHRTDDLARPGETTVGTAEMGVLVAEAAAAAPAGARAA